jgi:hypothetical protein
MPPECDNSFSYPYWTDWANGKLISIVDDSLAVLTSNRRKIECKMDNEYVTSSRFGLFLANYRTKQKPLSIDTTIGITFTEARRVGYYSNSYFSVVENYFKDSSVLVIDNINNRFGFWKMGTEYVPFEGYSYQENYALSKANPWINENILFKNSRKLSRSGETWDKTPMLNTKSRQIAMLDFTGEYGWLNECLDISYIGGKILCIKIKDTEINKFELVADGINTDELQVIHRSICDEDKHENYHAASCLNYTIVLDGNYIIKEIIMPLYIGGSIHEVYKIDTERFKLSNTFAPVWVYYDANGTRFYNGYNFDNLDSIDKLENFILYTPRDLFGAGY